MTDARHSLIDYDQIAQEYAQHRKVHPEVLRALLLESGIHGGSSVLEVGCGTGNYIAAVESAIGCPCWGIDPSREMLAEASESPGSVSFQVGRAEQLAFATGFFDLVFSVDVIHHLENVRGHFQEVWRVLRSGGRVCTVTDSEWIIRHRKPLAAYFPETVAVDLERYLRLTALRVYMEDAGLRDIEEELVEFAYEVTNSSPYTDRAFSALHLISGEAFRRGLRRMERDLRAGPNPGVSRHILLWGSKG